MRSIIVIASLLLILFVFLGSTQPLNASLPAPLLGAVETPLSN